MELVLSAFDHADIYGDYTTELDIGTVLKMNSALRSDIMLITKCGIKKICANKPEHKVTSYDSSATHIEAS